MITPGENGDKRAIQTLADIGPAVMNGGFSTFLAFITTCASESHVFLTFFKVIIRLDSTLQSAKKVQFREAAIIVFGFLQKKVLTEEV